MLYEELLKGTGAVENKATWEEYQRVEQIYMVWVLENIIPAAAYIRGMAEKANGIGRNYCYASPSGNRFELRFAREINCGSVVMYEFWANSKRVELEKYCQYGLLPSAEFQSYRANWYGKTKEELEDLFGFIA